MSAPRVGFRALQDADRDRLLAWRNSPAVAAYMYTDRLITPREHAAWFAALPGDPARAYWVIEMDGRPVGVVNLYAIDETAKSCAWAYYLADPATRGKGVGAFVEYAMLEHVLEERGLQRLWCEVLAENEAVWKLHESFGFEREALLEGHVVKGGVPLDVVRLSLTMERWRETRRACWARLAERGFSPPAPLG